MDGVLDQPLVRTFAVGNFPQKADEAERAGISTWDARRIKFEPARAVIGVAQAEFGPQTGVRLVLGRD